jgi:hypothetical protein
MTTVASDFWGDPAHFTLKNPAKFPGMALLDVVAKAGNVYGLRCNFCGRIWEEVHASGFAAGEKQHFCGHHPEPEKDVQCADS